MSETETQKQIADPNHPLVSSSPAIRERANAATVRRLRALGAGAEVIEAAERGIARTQRRAKLLRWLPTCR